MGYDPRYFPGNVHAWLKAGWLAKGHRLIEFGAQEFFTDTAEAARQGVSDFLKWQGFDPVVAAGIIGKGLPNVRTTYGAIGVDYTSIDVDGAFGCGFRRSGPPIPNEGGHRFRLMADRDSDDPGQCSPSLAL